MRFGIIAPLVQWTYLNESIAAYCRRVAKTPMPMPDSRIFQYKPKRWGNGITFTTGEGGMDALVPRTRCDKGATRVITEDAEREIRWIRQEYPRLNAAQIRKKLITDGTLAATVLVSIVEC